MDQPISLTRPLARWLELSGNWGLLLTSALLVAAVLIAYPLSSHFSLAQLVASHVVTIVAAALLKIAYVIRCIGRHEQGHVSL